MATVELPDEDWQKVMRFIATSVVWSEANPLLMKIGQQLQAQQVQAGPPMQMNSGKRETPDVKSH